MHSLAIYLTSKKAYCSGYPGDDIWYWIEIYHWQTPIYQTKPF